MDNEAGHSARLVEIAQKQATVSAISAIAALATVVSGVIIFLLQQQAQLEAEHSRRVYELNYAYALRHLEERQRVSRELADSFGELSSVGDASSFMNARQHYSKQYWGISLLLDDREVREALDSYRQWIFGVKAATFSSRQHEMKMKGERIIQLVLASTERYKSRIGNGVRIE